MDIAVIGDFHADPEVPNDRADWAGELIRDEEPDYCIQIGDWFNFASLSSYDKGKKKFEGRRYNLDLEAGWDALDRIMAPIKLHNSLRKKKHKTKFIITEGNHDHRAERAANDAAEYGDFIGRHNFKFELYDWEAHPFLEVVTIGGINFSHYFPSGPMGRAIGGVNPGRAMCNKLHESSVAGHSHVLNFASATTPRGKEIKCGTVGWFGDHLEDYLSASAQVDWWPGIVILRNVVDGMYDVEEIRMETIKQRYAK